MAEIQKIKKSGGLQYDPSFQNTIDGYAQILAFIQAASNVQLHITVEGFTYGIQENGIKDDDIQFATTAPDLDMYQRPNFTLSNVTETKTFMYQYNLLKPITEISALDLLTYDTVNSVDTVGFTLK